MIEVRRLPRRPGDAYVTADVTFRLVGRTDVSRAALVGDFNGWSTTATEMRREGDDLSATLALRCGTRYRFRYLIDGERWENDWAADDYEPHHDPGGGDVSVVDLGAGAVADPAADLRHADGPAAALPAGGGVPIRRFEGDRVGLAGFLRACRSDVA